MQFTTLAVASVFAAAVAASTAAHGNVTYVTEVLTEYTTYCPGPTTLTYNDVTYTITEATTLTITDCPCTVSKPVYVTPVVVCSTCEVKPSPVPSTPVYINSTVPETTPAGPAGPGVTPSQTAPGVITSGSPSGTGAPVPSKPAFTGAANRAAVGSAAGLAGLLGVAAYIL